MGALQHRSQISDLLPTPNSVQGIRTLDNCTQVEIGALEMRSFAHNLDLIFFLSIECFVGYMCMASPHKCSRMFNAGQCSHERGEEQLVTLRHIASFICSGKKLGRL